MTKLKYFLILLLFLQGAVSAQERSGLTVGVQYESTSHTNPYVYVAGNNDLNPEGVQGYSDNTSHFYFPFAYASYSEDGYSEMSTYAFHLLFVGVLNLINPNKEYKYTTDKTYTGDSYADGYSPVFDNAASVEDEGNYIPGNFGLEASFNDMDFVRLAYSKSMRETIGIPLMLGFQGGAGNMGVHFAKIREGHEPSDINNDHTGLVNFNETADLYFGANTGYVTEIMGDDLAMLQFQYNWYYFIDGTGEEMRFEGNKLLLELTYFPFSHEKPFLKNLFFKAFYKQSVVPYMKKFAESIPTEYTFEKIGFGVNLFIL